MKLTLPWSNKFKELFENKYLSDKQVIAKYLDYCAEQESRINSKWIEHEMNEDTSKVSPKKTFSLKGVQDRVIKRWMRNDI